VTLGVRTWWVDRRRHGERAHIAWRAGSLAEMRPGGACEADARCTHARTPGRLDCLVLHAKLSFRLENLLKCLHEVVRTTN
jgi:hypothetical protein